MNSRHALLATAAAGIVVASLTSLATPPSGILLNQILSFGWSDHDLSEHIVRSDAQGAGWDLKLKTHGPSDVYQQDIKISPGGYSGWHTHPGLLILTVVDGTIAWFDDDCVAHSYQAGDVLTESDTPHNLVNIGSVDAHVTAFYIIQKGQPRRQEVSAPACAPATLP